MALATLTVSTLQMLQVAWGLVPWLLAGAAWTPASTAAATNGEHFILLKRMMMNKMMAKGRWYLHTYTLAGKHWQTLAVSGLVYALHCRRGLCWVYFSVRWLTLTLAYS